MITIENIIESSKPHPNPPGRHTRLSNGIVEVSIVGGSRGLYGDFKNTFEVAIFDSKTREFKTKTFFPENNDDVISYIDPSKLVELVNKIFIDDNFQVL
jgi:hypothetical protein